MPGLLPNSVSLSSAASSTSRAADRRAFPKPFEERIHPIDTSAALSSNLPFAVRVFHPPVSQAMRVHSRLNPVTEVAKVEVCADQRITAGRMSADCGSSGSDHDPSSVCLVAMVNEFMESESVSRSERADSCIISEENGLAEISKSLQRLARRDDQEIKLLRDVQAIVESEDGKSGCVRTNENKGMSLYGCQKRMVISALQRIGYDAAICKTRWDHSGGLPGGNYEYIDVLFASDALKAPSRILVDIEFQAQFEIARPSSEFSAALQLVPPIFVGRPERLQQIVHLMAEATKQSLCIKGLHLPPWRKLNYMKAKWFSSYKRTSNDVSSSSRKQDGDLVNGGGFAGIAVRAYGLDPSYMNELELLCHGSKNLTGGSKDASSCSNVRDDLITVTTTDWQPPPLEVRPRSNTRSQRNVTGLASMLLHAGLPTCNEVVAKAA